VSIVTKSPAPSLVLVVVLGLGLFGANPPMRV
jgi:hypothetical protein